MKFHSLAILFVFSLLVSSFSVVAIPADRSGTVDTSSIPQAQQLGFIRTTIDRDDASGNQQPYTFDFKAEGEMADRGCCFLCGGCGAPPSKWGDQVYRVTWDGVPDGGLIIGAGMQHGSDGGRLVGKITGREGFFGQSWGYTVCGENGGQPKDEFTNVVRVEDPNPSDAYGPFFREGNKLKLRVKVKEFRCSRHSDNALNDFCDGNKYDMTENTLTLEVNPNGVDFFISVPPTPTPTPTPGPIPTPTPPPTPIPTPPPQCSGGQCCSSGRFYPSNQHCAGDPVTRRSAGCTAANGCPGTQQQSTYLLCTGSSGDCSQNSYDNNAWTNEGGCVAQFAGPCVCQVGQTQACPRQQGVCAGSVESCSQELQWPGCTDTTYRSHSAYYNSGADNTCDDRDNNCNGQVDEDVANKGQACNNGQQGVCARSGTFVCSTSGTLTCNAPQIPTNGLVEVCGNNADDDCDGRTDESPECACIAGERRNCQLQAGVCSGAQEVCGANQQWPGCNAQTYGTNYRTDDSLCDGLNNDCDDKTDEDTNFNQCMTGCSNGGFQVVGGQCCGNSPRERPGASGSYGTEECTMDSQGYVFLGDGTLATTQYDEDCDGSVNEGLNCRDTCPATGSTNPKGLLEGQCYPNQYERPQYCAPNPSGDGIGAVVHNCGVCGCAPPQESLGQYGPLTCQGDGRCAYIDIIPPQLHSFSLSPEIALRYRPIGSSEDRTQNVRFTADITDEGSQVIPNGVHIYYAYSATLQGLPSDAAQFTTEVPLLFFKPDPTGSMYEATWQWTGGSSIFSQEGYYKFKVVATDRTGNNLAGGTGGIVQTPIIQVVSARNACSRLHTSPIEGTNRVYDFFFVGEGYSSSADFAKYQDFVTAAANRFSGMEPFSSNANSYNLWRINAPHLELDCTTTTSPSGWGFDLPGTETTFNCVPTQPGITLQSVITDCYSLAPSSGNAIATATGIELDYSDATDLWKSDKVVYIRNADLKSSGWYQYSSIGYPVPAMTEADAVKAFVKNIGTSFGIYPYDFYYSPSNGRVMRLSEINPAQQCGSKPDRVNCALCDPTLYNVLTGCQLTNSMLCPSRGDVNPPDNCQDPRAGCYPSSPVAGRCQDLDNDGSPRNDYTVIIDKLQKKPTSN